MLHFTAYILFILFFYYYLVIGIGIKSYSKYILNVTEDVK